MLSCCYTQDLLRAGCLYSRSSCPPCLPAIKIAIQLPKVSVPPLVILYMLKNVNTIFNPWGNRVVIYWSYSKYRTLSSTIDSVLVFLVKHYRWVTDIAWQVCETIQAITSPGNSDRLKLQKNVALRTKEPILFCGSYGGGVTQINSQITIFPSMSCSHVSFSNLIAIIWLRI